MSNNDIQYFNFNNDKIENLTFNSEFYNKNIRREKWESFGGYNLIYAKKGGIPKNIFFKTKEEFNDYLIEHLCDMDLISLNDIFVDKNKLIENNKNLLRYLKIKNINI